MICKLLRIIAVLVILLLNAVPVFASDTATVTVTMTPTGTGGINNLLITYINDNDMRLTWSLTGDAANIMIRAKYGGYPNNIPDQNTTPSDGYLVYYGSGTSVDDTSMNFDQNPGYLYYSAWAQRGDGTWHMDTSTGWKESERLVFIGLIILAAILTYFAVTRLYVLGIPAVGLWIGIAYYISANPLPNITAGSSVDTIIHVVLWGVGALVGLYCAGRLFARYDERTFVQKAFGTGNDSQRVVNYNGDNKVSRPNPRSSNMTERQLAYRSDLHYRMHKNKQRRT